MKFKSLKTAMSKGIIKNRIAASAALVLCALLAGSCATGTAQTESGSSLLNVIEQAAQRLAGDLPQGSRVAVAAFESESEGLSAFIMEEFAASLSTFGVAVVARSGLDAVFAELDFQMSGHVSDETAVSLGRFLGAEFVITGQMLNMGHDWRLSANAVSVETAVRVSSPRFDVPGSEALQNTVAALGASRAAATAVQGGAFQQAPDAPSWSRALLSSPVSAGDWHSAAVAADGSLWTWGQNRVGQLGNGTAERGGTPAPARVGQGVVWAQVSAGSMFTVAIDGQGSLWAWGLNDRRQLGDGSTESRGEPAPVMIDAGVRFAHVSAGTFHTAAIATDRSLWTWGSNLEGQLGSGGSAFQPLPVRVGQDYDWAHVAAGALHTVAVKTDGTLWVWGHNGSGQLGLGGGSGRNTPVRVGVDTDWVYVAAGGRYTLAIKRDFSLWAWGSNNSGQLGDGTNVNRSSPVQVGPGVNWVSVSAGREHTVGLGSDGSLWTWGSNSDGRLGFGEGGGNRARHVPVRIGEYNEWAFVSASPFHTAAVAADGSVWTWGAGRAGQLGNGLFGDRDRPGQVADMPRSLAARFGLP